MRCVDRFNKVYSIMAGKLKMSVGRRSVRDFSFTFYSCIYPIGPTLTGYEIAGKSRIFLGLLRVGLCGVPLTAGL